MITSNGKQPREMTLAELKEELRIQKWLAREFRRIGDLNEYKYNRDLYKYEQENKAEKIKDDFKKGLITEVVKRNRLLALRHHKQAVDAKARNAQYMRIFEEATRLFIAEIEDAMEYHKPRPKHYKWIKPRVTPYKNQHNRYKHYITKEDIRVQNKKRILKNYEALINRNGSMFQWDKRKLMLIAKDRGYMTEIAVAYAIEQELDYPKQAVKTLLKTGKFTWGQVLCIGALFEMTPKEFCDTFMLGYFVEQGGDWRASYDNLDKNGLLSKPVIGYKSRSAKWKKEKESEEKEEDTKTD